jgi:hypothetical protein
MRKWLVQAVTPILCGLAVLLGAIALGRAARAGLHDHAAYTLAFADIDCPPPAGIPRQDFLSEVRTLTRQPLAVHVLDADVTARLHRAFAVHPWVESVRRVEIAKPYSSTGRLQSVVRVEVVYRQPVLTVCPSGEKLARTVDRNGVLLPPSAVQLQMPIFTEDVAAPSGPAGTKWGDARLAAAAKTVAYLRPHLARLRLNDCEVKTIEGEVVFRRPGVRVVWGHAPGQERDGEAPAEVKLRRLLDYRSGHDGLESLEHDVRLMAYQGHFPLPSNGLSSAASLYGSSQLSSSRNRDQVSKTPPNWPPEPLRCGCGGDLSFRESINLLRPLTVAARTHELSLSGRDAAAVVPLIPAY